MGQAHAAQEQAAQAQAQVQAQAAAQAQLSKGIHAPLPKVQEQGLTPYVPPVPQIAMTNDKGEIIPMKTTELFGLFLPKGAVLIWDNENPPLGWAICNGNNGKPINGLNIPDLRGRFIYGKGTNAKLLSSDGEEKHLLTIDEIPSHTHAFTKNVDKNNTCVCGGGECGCGLHAPDGVALRPSGGSPLPQPHENMPPYITLTYIIKYV